MKNKFIPVQQRTATNIKWFGSGVKLFGPSDRSVFDPYSLIHFLYGYGSFRLGLTANQTVLLSVLYEMIEDNIVEVMQQAQNDAWEKEDKYNALADVLMAILGYSVASNYKRKKR